MPRVGALLLSLLAVPLPARSQEIAMALRADRWAEAEALAAGHPDPVAAKIVLHARLLTPGAARAAEIAGFMATSPDWPQQAVLSRRLQEAVAAEGSLQPMLDACARRRPEVAAPLLNCAEISQAAALPDPARLARQSWLTGINDPAGEAAFLRQWAGTLSGADHQARFERLIWTDNGARNGPAARQAARLDQPLRAAALARLSLRRDDLAAPRLVAALSASERGDPGLMLDHARWLRRAGRDADAAALWIEIGTGAESAAPRDRKPAFWTERNLLARRLLRAGDPAGAYALASGHAQLAAEQVVEAEFLAGFIALRRLGRPEAAARHFRKLADVSKAAITQGRAHYWLGRAAPAEAARAAYAAAAAWPTTYYGQLAARALGENDAALAARLRALRDPAWTSSQAREFAGREMARAAALLATWGDAHRARPFLIRLDETAPDPAGRGLAAGLATRLGLPDQAVAIARRAGRDGLVLPEAGWPVAVEPPAGAVEAAVVLGLVRQESSFDLQAVSPAGARGLMQLMPATAAGVAQRLGEPASLNALTADAAYNMRLGTDYLRGLLDRFDGALPLALAGYNAGPSRVAEWLAAHGDPALGEVDMIDWIELIPFSETRNYVQRVVENVVIYRARQGKPAPHPLETQRP